MCGHPWRLGLATEEREREEAFRLRYDVFFREMGYGDKGIQPNGRDVDSYDDWCEHLILWDEEKQRLIGTYRAIPGGEAMKRGGFYGAVEFDLSPLEPMAGRILQGSRTCVHADYRGTVAFHYLSYGMDLLLRKHGCDCFLGADSFHSQGPDHLNLVHSYVRKFAYHPKWDIQPMPPSRVEGIREVPITAEYERHLPTVIRMDLRLGFRACSPVVWDPDFKSYDILFLGQRSHLSKFYISLIDRVEKKTPTPLFGPRPKTGHELADTGEE